MRKPPNFVIPALLGYATVALVAGLIWQTYYLGDEKFAYPSDGRTVALQVHGAIVYVSSLEYWINVIGRWSSILIILGIVFGTALKKRFGK